MKTFILSTALMLFRFSDQHSRLTGQFVFPDGSLHPLETEKLEEGRQTG
jgi:hypothetical protein